MAVKNKSNELKILRIFDAPVKAVWDAWTDPKQVVQWWGPRGFSHTTHSKDLRPGGKWVYTMHGPDGTDYPNITTYHEVEKLKKLVYDHGATETSPPLFRVTALFSEHKGKTKLDMTMAFATPDVAEEMGKFIKKAGGNSTWDRLAEYLDKSTTGKERFVINRSFEAPIEQMYKMWVEPEHFSRWLPPTGFTMKFLRADIRPGGSAFYSMTNGTFTMFGRCEYLELNQPDRIVYRQQFCDEKENMARHPMAPTWPATMLTVVTLTAEDADRTRVTVEWEPGQDSTAEEIATFVKERAGMTVGWTGSFDKLEGLLEN